MACIVERVAGAHHGFAEIDAVDGAERDVAVVLVDLDWFAGDAAAADRGRKRAHRRAPAGIGLAVGVAAVLLALRRGHAVQADAYAGDFERISVDHARRTGDRLARCTWWPLQNVRNRRQHGEDQQPDHDGRRAAHDSGLRIERYCSRRDGLALGTARRHAAPNNGRNAMHKTLIALPIAAVASLAWLAPNGTTRAQTAVPAEVLKELASTGKLRAGINTGNSVLAQKSASGELTGISV